MPDELRAFLEVHDWLTEDRSQLIADYQYFLVHYRQRRPEVWANRRELMRTPLGAPVDAEAPASNGA